MQATTRTGADQRAVKRQGATHTIKIARPIHPNKSRIGAIEPVVKVSKIDHARRPPASSVSIHRVAVIGFVMSILVAFLKLGIVRQSNVRREPTADSSTSPPTLLPREGEKVARVSATDEGASGGMR